MTNVPYQNIITIIVLLTIYYYWRIHSLFIWCKGDNCGGNWLRNHLWCTNDPRGLRIDDNDDEGR